MDQVSYLGTKHFGLEASLGHVEGYATVDKFGCTPDADSGVLTDIWDGADGVTGTKIWVPPTQARIHDLVSTSAEDGAGGSTGMLTCRVYGLKTWSSVETSEDKTLNGTTPVPTDESYVIIHRIEGMTWGSNRTNVGIITATAQTDATITAMIHIGMNQTQMAIYGIPDTQSMHMELYFESILGSGLTTEADGRIAVTKNPEAANPGYRGQQGIHFSNTVHLFHPFSPPKRFTGPAIVKLQTTTDANGSIVTGGFDAYVVDN